MHEDENVYSESVKRMRENGASDIEISSFISAFQRYVSDTKVEIPEESICPINDVPSLSMLPQVDYDDAPHIAMIRLNGGIGTTMGLNIPKSLIEAREGKRFIDIILSQADVLKKKSGVKIPLILLDSDVTHAAMDEHIRLPKNDGLPHTIIQGVFPRIVERNNQPLVWEENPRGQWAPPGHGDLLTQLSDGVLLHALLDAGYTYLFVANADNLGAFPEPSIPAWMEKENIAFVAEVVQRTKTDIKGGHFARRIADDALIIREIAQTPQEDLPSFTDITKHKYLNTNNLWFNIAALCELVEAGEKAWQLPLIVNHKNVQIDGEDIAVVQLESALGSIVEKFETSQILEVPRIRFFPVKNTNDLFILRSDAVYMDDDFRLREKVKRPLVDLAKPYFGAYAEFEKRVQAIPSLRAVEELKIETDMVIRGDENWQGRVHIKSSEA